MREAQDNSQTMQEMLEALKVANHIIYALLPMQMKYGAGIGPNEQADLDLINNAIKKAEGENT